MGKVVLDVKGMTCHHCVMAVTKAIESVDGTEDVNVSLEQGRAEFFIEDEANVDQVKANIRAAGYEV